MAIKKSENSEIAVLQTQMETALKTLDRVEGKLDQQHALYAPAAELESVKKDVDFLKTENDKLKGAMAVLKGLYACLTLVALILGALWWTR